MLKKKNTGFKNKDGDIYAASVWLGTMFNYERILNMQTFFDDMYHDPQNDGKIGYITGQIERCPTTDRLHLQFAVFATCGKNFKISRSKMQQLIEKHGGGWSNLVACTVDNGVRAYCQKEKTRVEGPWQIGVPPKKLFYQ